MSSVNSWQPPIQVRGLRCLGLGCACVGGSNLWRLQRLAITLSCLLSRCNFVMCNSAFKATFIAIGIDMENTFIYIYFLHIFIPLRCYSIFFLHSKKKNDKFFTFLFLDWVWQSRSMCCLQIFLLYYTNLEADLFIGGCKKTAALDLNIAFWKMGKNLHNVHE